MAEKDEIKVLVEVEVQKALKNYDKLNQKADTFVKGAGKGFNALKLAGIGLAGVVGGKLTQSIVNASKKAGEFEQLNIAFTTFLGSADKAKKVIKDLQEFSARTPFETEKVNASAKSLLAFGTAQADLLPTLKTLGDISAGTGKDLKELSVIYGQIQSTGRLLGQDLLQLINAGFNPLQQISKDTGRSVAELKDEMSKGNITFAQVEEAFKNATKEGGLFFNLTEKQSQSFLGKVSTLKSNIDVFVKDIGSKFIPVLGQIVTKLTESFDNRTDLEIITTELTKKEKEYATALKETKEPLDDVSSSEERLRDARLSTAKIDIIKSIKGLNGEYVKLGETLDKGFKKGYWGGKRVQDIEDTIKALESELEVKKNEVPFAEELLLIRSEEVAKQREIVTALQKRQAADDLNYAGKIRLKKELQELNRLTDLEQQASTRLKVAKTAEADSENKLLKAKKNKMKLVKNKMT